MGVIARLASRYPDLHQAELDLDEMTALRQRLNDLSRPAILGGAKDPGFAGVRPQSIDDLLKLREAGVISDATVRWFLGVEEQRREPLPPLPAPHDLWDRHVLERVGFGAIWRIGLLPAVLLVPALSRLESALALLVAAVAVALVASTTGVWKRLNLGGAVWREGAALVLFYAAFRFAPQLGLLIFVGVILVLGLGADALLSVLGQEDL